MYTHQIAYKRACLNCLKAVNAKYLHIIQNEDKEIQTPSTSKKSEEFYLIQLMKSQLWNKREKCQICGAEGCFDIWDMELNGRKLYEPLDNDTIHAQFYLEKLDNGNTQIEFRPYTAANLVTFLSFFSIVQKILDNTPKGVFIEKEKGFVDAIVYLDENTGNVDVNRFRHVGFSKEEIATSIENLEKQFKEEYDIDWE